MFNNAGTGMGMEISCAGMGREWKRMCGNGVGMEIKFQMSAGMGWGWKRSRWGWDGDGKKFDTAGREWGPILYPCHSLVSSSKLFFLIISSENSVLLLK